MQSPLVPLPEDSDEIAKKIRSGEFFRESMNAYHARYIDLLSERYLFLAITAFSILIFFLSLVAMMMLYPLKTDVPFIYQANDLVDDIPTMKRLGDRSTDPNMQLKEFMVSNYVKLRENYSIDILDRNAEGVRSQSTDEVYANYAKLMDPRNPSSPIALYQRQGIRRIQVTSTEHSAVGTEERMVVNFVAAVNAAEGTKKVNMRAIITFRFDEIEVNQKTGESSPLGFIVTVYETETVG